MADDFAAADWVPRSVADAAARLYAAARYRNRKAVIARLATDDRMRQVWKTLRENHRGKVKPAQWPKTVPEREIRAAVVFEAACQTYVQPYTKADIRLTKARFEDIAAHFENGLDDFVMARALVRHLVIEVADEIGAIHSFIAKLRDAIEAVKRLPVVSHRGTARRRAYLIALARAMRDNFGTDMYGTVATIAGVALNQKVTEKMVQGALESAGAKLPH
jgi:hypothetical protein